MEPRRPRRILIATEYFPPHWTGISKAIDCFARELARENSVTVLTTRFDASLPEIERVQGVRVLRAPFLFRISRTQYSPQTIPMFIRLMKDCDHVILNSPHSNILFLALIAKLFRKRLTVYHQGDFVLPRFERRPVKKFIIERIFDLLTIPAMALADRIATYTYDYAAHSRVMRHFPRKTFAAIPRLPRAGAVTRGEVQKRLKALHADHTLIGFAGRFVEEKGFDILLKAIPLVVEKLPNAIFVFAGETNVAYERCFAANQALITKSESRLCLLGLLRDAAIWEFYRGLDVFVLSSRSDCFALTQLEAATTGVPIVVTDIPGARVLVKETGFGELVPPENPQALADGIVRVATRRAAYLAKRENVDAFLMAYEKLEAA